MFARGRVLASMNGVHHHQVMSVCGRAFLSACVFLLLWIDLRQKSRTNSTANHCIPAYLDGCTRAHPYHTTPHTHKHKHAHMHQGSTSQRLIRDMGAAGTRVPLCVGRGGGVNVAVIRLGIHIDRMKSLLLVVVVIVVVVVVVTVVIFIVSAPW